MLSILVIYSLTKSTFINFEISLTTSGRIGLKFSSRKAGTFLDVDVDVEH